MRVARAVVALLTFASALAGNAGTRRALLIGIDDYSATHLVRPANAVPPPRDRVWPQLQGAVNDVETLKAILLKPYRFTPDDVAVLENQNATRAAVFDALEKLTAKITRDDVVLFYYAGHGSQVRNTLSEENDKLDESVLPADSRLGAPDIRDKELRRVFNRMLDRGARLTAIFDTCHSGSAGRNALLIASQVRGVAPDLRDVRDGSKDGPWPEHRGALILSATDDEGTAAEIVGGDHQHHGAFSWSWFCAISEDPGEAAADAFARARARLRVEMPTQDPVIAGTDDARLAPFLGSRADRRNGKTAVAVSSVESDGTVIIDGGWANGIGVGSQLENGGQRLEVVALDGITRCHARVVKGRSADLHAGTLLHVAGWVAPVERPMQVFIARTSATTETLAASARAMIEEAARRKLRWIADPTETAPDFVVRRRDSLWEVVAADGRPRLISTAPADLLGNLPAGASLFVQLPADDELIRDIAIHSGSESDGIVLASKPQDADYVLAGRYVRDHLEYAWLRALGTSGRTRRTGLPARTDWRPRSAVVLRDAARRLRRVHAWLLLGTPPGMTWPYELGLRHVRDKAEVTDGTLIGGEQYQFFLRARRNVSATLPRRHVYVFSVDSFGRGVLLYPVGTDSVENRFPLPAHADATIELGPASMFRSIPPYGTDTYFMLTSDQNLSQPAAIFNFDGSRDVRGTTVLEQLLTQVGEPARGSAPVATPATWSIDRVVFESMPRR